MMKWADAGFWKSLLFYRQSVLYYWLLSAWYRSFTWYGAANPAITHAGMLNEKKSAIYPLLPADYLPATSGALTAAQILEKLASGQLDFPLVIKPDIGLKGIAVKVCHHKEALISYLASGGRDLYIVQEYLDQPREFSVLFYRAGFQKMGISSFIEKKYPIVSGDGKRTLHQLIDSHRHAYLNKAAAKSLHPDRILAANEIVVLHTIGNYAQGSTFHSLQHEIDGALLQGVLQCMNRIKDIDFCRLDIKAQDVNAVRQGDFKIIEINGGKSEPLHIYDKGISFWQAIRIIHEHWKLYTIVVDYHLTRGFKMMSTAEGVKALRHIKQVVKNKDK
jgi:hypothetical protein